MVMNENNLPPDPLSDPRTIVVGQKEGMTLFNREWTFDVLMQLSLPGIVIFVHGVNSDGEWYEQAEQGLCQGLNERLKRCDEHLKYTGMEAGQLFPASYMPDLDPDGYLNPKKNAKTFIQGEESFSPVIHFRWGYKASAEELKQYGGNIYLNEQNYWGGGPFANGCSSLPDLWSSGLDDQLFLWIHAQHLNPTHDRQVYSCPPRPYYVLHAYRLARLVESLRRRQADVPITIVCHSQGNMVGLCAAFLGDNFAPATDVAGKTGRCVADTYVLCNPPYSLLEDNFTENWAQRDMQDPEGRTGRQTLDARTKTLAAFFDLIRQRQPLQQAAERIDRRMGNEAQGFTAQIDRKKYGLGGSTYGRVTLYCNPHDQVISATPVQGIGWRGMSLQEVQATHGEGVFTQRVFAQGYRVGQKYAVGQPAVYDCWRDRVQPVPPGSWDYWQPHSPYARYSLAKGLDANTRALAKATTFMLAPWVKTGVSLARIRINGLPPDDWKIPVLAPPLPEPFLPEAVRFGQASQNFDQGHDASADYRNPERERTPDDPYHGAPGEQSGDAASEAAMRYENHAVLRMKARRQGLYKPGEKVMGEDDPLQADEQYKAWQREQIQEILKQSIDTHATDHSTILTNPMHSRRALAYDVAIGCCDMGAEDLHQLRIAADWRYLEGLPDDDPNKRFLEYFKSGQFRGGAVSDWANAPDSEVRMPEKIINERSNAPAYGPTES